jgi:cation transport ATPase
MDHQHSGHGDHAARFRDRFWWSLALTVPVVAYSEMVQEWLGFTPPQFPGSQWVAPVLGTAVFLYGGWPFLEGGLAEARARQPGMMLLISLAILVGFGASAASALGLFDLEFWWELALLIVIMLLGHWLEMRALGQASTPWPRSCPTRPTWSPPTGPGRCRSATWPWSATTRPWARWPWRTRCGPSPARPWRSCTASASGW